MPRSRGSEMSSQRQSPRVPLHLKMTAASEANSLHRLTTDRSSPKPDDHRSPRSGPLHEKKRGTRVADLETKLGQAQEELKKLKEELASAEAAKLNAQQELEEAKKQKQIPEGEEEKPFPTNEATITHHPDPQDDENNPPIEQDLPKLESLPVEPPATDVFEVIPPPLLPTEPQEGSEDNNGEEGEKAGKEKEEEEEEGKKAGKEEEEAGEKAGKEGEETETLIEVEESKPAEFPESPEIVELRAKLAEKEKELEIRSTENESLNKQATEAMEIATAAQAKEKELGAKLQSVEEELRESRAKTELLVEQLKATERGRAALEAEMKRVEVQTEQWRKVAEEAASVLAAGDGVEAGARRVAERCGSMDNRWSSLMGGGEMDDEGLGGGKRRGSGIRMFGDLWKKGHHHK